MSTKDKDCKSVKKGKLGDEVYKIRKGYQRSFLSSGAHLKVCLKSLEDKREVRVSLDRAVEKGESRPTPVQGLSFPSEVCHQPPLQ